MIPGMILLLTFVGLCVKDYIKNWKEKFQLNFTGSESLWHLFSKSH